MNFAKRFSLASSPINFGLDKGEAKKTGRFVAFFMLLYLAISSLFYFAVPEQAIQFFIAETTAFVFGGQVALLENPVVTLSSGTMIEISSLCTGFTELFIIVAAILASIGISARKRLAGAAVAAVAVFALNIVRIFATIALILGTGDLAVIELAHDVFFRIFLFISIAAIYIAWFYWAVASSPKQKL